MFSLAITALPDCDSATWSITGPIMRHGPHHSAWKSTSTGCVVLLSVESKVTEVSSGVFMAWFWFGLETDKSVY